MKPHFLHVSLSSWVPETLSGPAWGEISISFCPRQPSEVAVSRSLSQAPKEECGHRHDSTSLVNHPLVCLAKQNRRTGLCPFQTAQIFEGLSPGFNDQVGLAFVLASFCSSRMGKYCAIQKQPAVSCQPEASRSSVILQIKAFLTEFMAFVTCQQMHFLQVSEAMSRNSAPAPLSVPATPPGISRKLHLGYDRQSYLSANLSAHQATTKEIVGALLHTARKVEAVSKFCEQLRGVLRGFMK